MKKSQFNQLAEARIDVYSKSINAMTGKGPGTFSKKTAADLKAGHADGVYQGMGDLLVALGQTLEEG